MSLITNGHPVVMRCGVWELLGSRTVPCGLIKTTLGVKNSNSDYKRRELAQALSAGISTARELLRPLSSPLLSPELSPWKGKPSRLETAEWQASEAASMGFAWLWRGRGGGGGTYFYVNFWSSLTSEEEKLFSFGKWVFRLPMMDVLTQKLGEDSGCLWTPWNE